MLAKRVQPIAVPVARSMVANGSARPAARSSIADCTYSRISLGRAQAGRRPLPEIGIEADGGERVDVRQRERLQPDESTFEGDGVEVISSAIIPRMRMRPLRMQGDRKRRTSATPAIRGAGSKSSA